MKKLLILVLIIALIFPVYAQNNPDISSNVTQGYNPDYNILPIILALFMFYLITYLLLDNANLKRRNFRQIWSIVLVGSFLYVGISGIILSFLSDYDLILPINFSILFWHVEAGIIMSITTLLHIHIHRKALLRFLKFKINS